MEALTCYKNSVYTLNQDLLSLFVQDKNAVGIVWLREPVWSFLGDKYEGAYAQVRNEDKWGERI